MIWFTVEAGTTRVLGWSSSGATSLPAAAPGLAVFQCSAADTARYDALQSEAIADGREPTVLRDAATGTLSLPPDTRPVMRVAVDKAAPMVGEIVNVTVTRLDDPAFTGSFDAELASGRLFRLDFVNGVAQRTFSFSASGVQRLTSSLAFKLETPVEFRVAE